MGDALATVAATLRDVYTAEGVALWLLAPQRGLHGERPVDAIRDGHAEQVLALAERLAGGSRQEGSP